jgi:hypothetical protein
VGYVPNELFGRLVGCRLYSVEFVMDYIQLRFDNVARGQLTLNCYVMPKVERAAEVMRDGDVGYGDAVRALIPGHVRAANDACEAGLRIELDTGSLVLNPSPDELVGPEIAFLFGFDDHSSMVWRPGEHPFAHLA